MTLDEFRQFKHDDPFDTYAWVRGKYKRMKGKCVGKAEVDAQGMFYIVVRYGNNRTGIVRWVDIDRS